MKQGKLIKGCINNRRKAQEYMYKQYFDIVKNMCLRYTKDEDYLLSVINDAFLKVFKNIHTYEGRGSLEGWIRKITFHSISDHFRKENKYIKRVSFEVNETFEESSALSDLYYADLLERVENLPNRSKEVFKKYVISGYSHKEIASQMNIPIGTSKWHLSEARKMLKKNIQQDKIAFGYA